MEAYEYIIFNDKRVKVYAHIYVLGSSWTWALRVDEFKYDIWKHVVFKHSKKFFECPEDAMFDSVKTLTSNANR